MRPETQETRFDDRPVSDIVANAVTQWEALTGVTREQSTFSFGGLGVHSMNKMLDEALALDPEGTTAYLLLEVFLRFYLEEKTFTAAEIMKDYDKTTGFLRDAEALFTVVQSERAQEISADFRARVLEGLARYNADRPEVVEFLNDPDVLPFLRRDALRSINQLEAFQFLDGASDSAHPQAIQNVHMAWSINDLLAATRDMPVSGIALVLMRDATHPSRSYFSFVMRNGENVILFTDRKKPAYPGQEDVLSGRGGRGAARSYAERENANHFPYQIIPTSYDDEGDLRFDKETAPIAAGLKLAPLMSIGELPPAQAIWVTMMLSLVSDRFWKKSWRADALSYTGAMIRKKDDLVTDDAGRQLPVAKGYQPITLEEVTHADMAATAVQDRFDYKPEGFNDWMVDRYGARVPQDVLNIWHRNPDERLMLPKSVDTSDLRETKANLVLKQAEKIGEHVIAIKDYDALPSWERVKGYELSTFSPSAFGTEAELQRDRIFVSRKNYAAYIQKLADEEFGERISEVLTWYRKALKDNVSGLMQLIADGPDAPVKNASGYHRSLHAIAEIKDDQVFGLYSHYGWGQDNMFGEFLAYGQKYACYLTDAKSTYRAAFSPRSIEDIELLTGMHRNKIPDVLHHWGNQARHSGNHLLNRIDPIETDLRNPWNSKNIKLEVNFYLSKRGLARIKAGKFERG